MQISKDVIYLSLRSALVDDILLDVHNSSPPTHCLLLVVLKTEEVLIPFDTLSFSSHQTSVIHFIKKVKHA